MTDRPAQAEGHTLLEAARARAVRLVVLGGWGFAPVPLGAALLADNPLVPVLLGVALFAAIGGAALALAGPAARIVAGVALIGQATVLTAALAGHPWQVDSHMAFFAMLAVLMILSDARAILVAAAVIVVHHLVLALAMPGLIYPAASLLLNVERVLIHGAAVAVETAALVYAVTARAKVDRQVLADRARLSEASAASEASRARAETALAEAEQARAEALAAQSQAEEAARRAETETERARRADAEAREAERRDRAREAELQAGQTEVVEALGRALRALAARDLHTALEAPFSEDYESLRRDFNTAVAALRGAMESLLDTAASIGRQSGEISSATVDLAKRTETQAATLAELSTSVSSIATTVQETARTAQDAHRAAGETSAEAGDSSRLVNQAVDAMSQLEESSGRIRSIIRVIDDIAFQTNLLALNAGVEAARAGEAGRGFAVVASEVRALAQRSSEAALEIKALIETSSRHVSEGVDLVRRTGDSLRAVTSRVDGIASRVGEISGAAERQATGLAEIDSALGDLDRVTQSNAAMFEETSASNRQLSDDTEDLVRTISEFLPRRRAAPAPAAERPLRQTA